jgi:DNA repair protein RadC
MESTNQQHLWQVAEIELSYRPTLKAAQHPKIESAKHLFDILTGSWDMNKIELVEQFKIVLLNRANRVLGLAEISTGGMSATVVDPKIIFMIALKAAATGICLVHNHPSGNLRPSQADHDLTEKLRTAARVLDMQILDHLIITRLAYFSFAEEGLM